MKRYYKLLFFLALCVLGLSMVVAADIGKITVETTALEQQVAQQIEEIKVLKAEIAELHSRTPVDGTEPMDEIFERVIEDGK